MRNIFILCCMAFSISACKPTPSLPAFYGKTFDTMSAISIAELARQIESKTRIDAIVYGQIEESCQSEGCWLSLENSNGKAIFVDWDHQFNTPFDIKGRRAVVMGYAYLDSSKSSPEIAFKATAVHL